MSGQRYRIYTLCKSRGKESDCAKKAKIKKRISFKESRQNCLTSKNLCPILIICRLFRVFIPATAICTRALWYLFLSVCSNLCTSKIHFKGINSNKNVGRSDYPRTPQDTPGHPRTPTDTPRHPKIPQDALNFLCYSFIYSFIYSFRRKQNKKGI